MQKRPTNEKQTDLFIAINKQQKKPKPTKQQRMQECDHLGTIHYLLFLLIKSICTTVTSRSVGVGAGTPIAKW